MSKYFLCVSLICGAFIFNSGTLVAKDASSRPNIVLIMCDDMGWSDIGCYGGEVETPHLNLLAKEGMRFTQFYNNAKCTTTRASILTGLYPRRGKGGLLRNNMVTIGEAMKLAGYQTSLSGKWHLGGKKETHPFHRGFDEFYGLLDGCCNFFDPSIPDPPYKNNRVRQFGQNDQRITSFPKNFYSTDAFTDHAIDCVKKFSKNDSPFLVHLTYTAPHYPLHAKPKDIAKYRGKYRDMGGWLKMRDTRWEKIRSMGLATNSWKLSEEDKNSYDWGSANQDHEDLRMAVYAAMIDSMDQNIGRLRTALEQAGVLDNTLILFLSDNGGCAEEPGGRSPKIIPGPKEYYASVGPAWGWAQNAPFKKHKSRTYEGGVLTPCIAWWPGRIEANKITRQPAHIIDIMPTLLELAGSEYPTEHAGQKILPVEGKSMLPILMGKQREPHAQLAWEWAGSRALREGNWKVVWSKDNKKWELYNLAEDRCEITNLATDKPSLTKRLSESWFDWASKTGLKIKQEKSRAKKSREPKPKKGNHIGAKTEKVKANGAHMANGIKIGEVNSTSAIIWTRLTANAERNVKGLPFKKVKLDEQPEYADLSLMQGSVVGKKGEVKVKYWPAGKPDKSIATDWVKVDETSDFINQFRIEKLQPDTKYEVLVKGRASEDRCLIQGKFRTAPTKDDGEDISFVVTTCGDYPRRDDDANGHVIYQTMLGLAPDFLVHAGDAEYYDKPKPYAINKRLARFKWNRIYSMPFLRTFHNQVPCYFIKDDHDTVKNDCWPGAHYGDLTWEQGVAIHKEQVPMGNKPYRTVRWGKHLQIWLVEGREFRSPNSMKDGPKKTIWGEEQKKWFFETVEQSDATFKILLSATPVVGPDRKNKKDNHSNANFTYEGNQIREFIAKQGNMFIVCGDRHWQYATIDPKTGAREFSCGPASDRHAAGYKEDADPLRHKYLLVKGGFLRVMVKNETKQLVFNHHAVDGTVRYKEVFGSK